MDRFFDVPKMKEIVKSRLSGEPIEISNLLIDLESAPLPGVYVDNLAEAALLHSRLKIFQSKDGFVQTAHYLPEYVYRNYGFAGGGNIAYASHLERIANKVVSRFDKSSCILEVGCGDGTLLGFLSERGFRNLEGIDPSPQAELGLSKLIEISMGYFPRDLPAKHSNKKYDLIICRHVLEHIETPHEFVSAMCDHLAESGQIWIEVPDLYSTIKEGWWTNFYSLHCNYFEEATLDAMMATHGLSCFSGEIVDIFGGSLFRCYEKGFGLIATPHQWNGVTRRIKAWVDDLTKAAESLPEETWGWGAAERTSSTLAFCPQLCDKLRGVVDSNRRIHGKFMAGTGLKIYPTETIEEIKPSTVILFALSYKEEIIKNLANYLPKGTMVLVPADPVQRVYL